MNFSPSLELQAGTLDVAQQFSWESSLPQSDDLVEARASIFRASIDLPTELLADGAVMENSALSQTLSPTTTLSIMRMQEQAITSGSLGTTLKFEQQASMSRLQFDATPPSASFESKSYSVESKHHRLRFSSSTNTLIDAQPSTQAQTLLNRDLPSTMSLTSELHFSSVLGSSSHAITFRATTLTMEGSPTNSLQSQVGLSDSFPSSWTVQESAWNLSFGNGLSIASTSIEIAGRSTGGVMAEQQTNSLPMTDRWHLFSQTLTQTQRMPALESLPALTLEQMTSLRVEDSPVACDLFPSFDLSVSRSDTFMAAKPDLTIQSSQQVAMGLLGIGLG